MEPLAIPTAKQLPAKLEPVDLSGRTILVTGASGGFGRALAIDCGRAGASVVLAGRNGAKLDRLYDEIVALGAPQPAIVQLDLASATAQDYDRLSDTIDREFGKLDGLVHAAALLGDRTPLEQYDVPTWCRVLHVNLTAPFILTQVLLPNLRKFHSTMMDRAYYDLLRIFANALERENAVLFAFGFSFEDEHILDICRRSLRNPTAQLVIFSHSPEGVTKYEAKFSAQRNVLIVSPASGEELGFEAMNDLLSSALSASD